MYRILLVLCIFLPGCTAALWESQYSKEVNVNGFYVNQETNDIVVTSMDTAYLFPSEAQLGQALILSRDVEFSPAFKNFSLSKSNIVRGNITLVLVEEKPTPALIERLRALGFEEEPTTQRFQLARNIQGKRYTIEGELPLETLDRQYTIKVDQPSGPIETAGKVVATPAAITFDAVAILPSALLLATLMSLAGNP